MLEKVFCRFHPPSPLPKASLETTPRGSAELSSQRAAPPGKGGERRNRSKVHSSPWREILDPLIRILKKTFTFPLEGVGETTKNIS